VKICADGSSMRLLDFCSKNCLDFIPSIICGDLDSADANVLKFYASKVMLGLIVYCSDFLHQNSNFSIKNVQKTLGNRNCP